MTVGIYCLYFEQDRDLDTGYYIGQSININKRFKDHCSTLEKHIHRNYKLQNAYSIYGLPTMSILTVCSDTSSLNDCEIYWINEFDSYYSGLNLTLGGDCTGYGHLNPGAKHDEETYLSILNMLAYSNLSRKDISLKLDVSEEIVKQISLGARHTYLEISHPIEYSIMRSKYTQCRSANAKQQGIIYPEVLSPVGEVHIISNLSEFCRQHKLDTSTMCKVMNKKLNQHKGWIINERPSS